MRTHRRLPAAAFAALFLLASCGGSALPVRRVVLYQNGIGYFERSGSVPSGDLTLRFAEHEVDDALKTLTVIGARGGATISASVPHERPTPAPPAPGSAPGSGGSGEGGSGGELAEEGPRDVPIRMRLSDGARGRLLVAYAVPVPTWRAAYRLVLDEPGEGPPEALLQAWALVHNASAEDWEDVQLTLATSAPFSFAMDLRSPRFLPRPDVSGQMVQPVATGIVRADRARGGSDSDGIPDDRDLCPADDEDMDGFEDQDGCPDPDNDRDRILDVDDQCPNDPETYNGTEDEDGCPDSGRVLIEDSAIVILEKIYFTEGSAEVGARSLPILDAVAATLRGNPQIGRVTLRGHAADNEAQAWALSAERAGAVRAALIERGVPAARLAVEPLGATRPIAPGESAEARERNRRVEFHIEEGADGGSGPSRPRAPSPPPSPTRRSPPAPTLSARSAQGPARPLATLSRELGGALYNVTGGVHVPARSTALVSLIDQRVRGEEIYLFRPDPSARGSARHPFRAARFTNGSRFSLVPGPVALFARGRYVGEGLLEALDSGETAYLPYAVDTATSVRSELVREEEPVRILSIERGIARLQSREVRTTRYHIAVGAEAPRRIYVRHRRALGYELGELPPRTQEQGTAVLIPLPIEAGTESVLPVTESRLVDRRISLLNDLRSEIAAFLEGSTMSQADRERLVRALSLRDRIVVLDARIIELRRQIGDAATRTAELRANVRALDEAGRRRSPLRNQLEGRLEEAAALSERLATELSERNAERAATRVELSAVVEEISVPAPDDVRE